MSRSPKGEMLKGFIGEVDSYIPSLIQGLESLRERPDRKEVLEEVHRLVHTIKGASSMMGISGLSHIALQMEETLDDIISGELKFTDAAFPVMSDTIEKFQEYCRGFLSEGVNSRAMVEETVTAYRQLRGFSPGGNGDNVAAIIESIPEHEKADIETDDDETGAAVQIDERSIDHASEDTDDDQKESPSLEDILESSSVKGEPERLVEEKETSESTQIKKSPDVPLELLESFWTEADEHLEELGRSLTTLESQILEPVAISSSQREEIRRIRRSVHTLKGASAVIGLHDFSTFAHNLEDLLDWLYEQAQEITPEIVSILADALDLLERIVKMPQEAHSPRADSLKEQYQKIMGQPSTAQQISPSLNDSDNEIKEALPSEAPPVMDPDEDSLSEMIKEKVPANLSMRPTQTLRVDMERVDELVNLAGELLIALSGYDQKMDIFREAVDELELSRERLKDMASQMAADYEVKALEQIGSALNLAVADSGKAYQGMGFSDFDSLELDRYSQLNLIIRMLNESAVDVGAIHTQLTNLHSDMDGHLNRQRVVLSELQDKMMRIRMTPMSIITNRLRQTVRELAGHLNKKVRLVITGADIELDKVVWEKITDPLMHLLRNAVDHGVESLSMRQELEKPAVATVNLDASREGNQVVIRVADDGAGLNYPAIRKTAQRMQLAERVDAVSEDKLAGLIFYPGFSTRGKISEVSGRGVGMDVVKENIENLKGTVKVASKKGKGTQFTIRIPLTMAAVRALLFKAGGQVFAIALNEINEIFRLNPDNILKPHGDAVRIGEEVLPLFQMTKILNTEEKDSQTESTSEQPVTLVVASGDKRGAVVVDSLVSQQEIVIKSLGSHLRYVKGISGATIMGDGSVVPILNIEEFFWAGTTESEQVVSEGRLMLEEPLEILVVDDSVSIRQVVSRLLEDQGWGVKTAKDGINALEKLRESRPDLIILDIEMPRMNGFELLGALKAQPEYQDIPVAMLTSRNAAKHRDKAKALGANGFVVKPYNDEKFISLILELTAESRKVEHATSG